MNMKERFNATLHILNDSDRLQDQLEHFVAAPLICLAVRPLQPDGEEDGFVWINDRVTTEEAIQMLLLAAAKLKPGSATPPCKFAPDYVPEEGA